MSTKVTMTISEGGTSSNEKLGCSIGILKSMDGILKIFQLLIPIICLIMIFKGELAGSGYVAPITSFSLVICYLACGLPTFLLIVSHMMSPVTASVISKMAYDFLNNMVSCLFYGIANMLFLIFIATSELENIGKPIAVAVMGLLNALLYSISAYFSLKLFKSS